MVDGCTRLEYAVEKTQFEAESSTSRIRRRQTNNDYWIPVKDRKIRYIFAPK